MPGGNTLAAGTGFVLYCAAVSVLSANGLCKHYGERVILDDVRLTIERGERVGLVGINGSGKTTLARILASLEESDGGRIIRGRGVTMAYLEQDPDLDPAATALEVVLAGLADWTRAVARHDELSAAISEATGDLEQLLAAQAGVAADVERLGGWDLRHRAEAMLGHLGVDRPERRVGPMSGGERRRVALARLLVAAPDIAILDEPTNHLDLDTIEWLENYLREQFRGALLVITHDRYLLDRVVTRTLEIDAGAVHSYDGGWESYLAAKAEREAFAERAAANRRNFLRRELEWLRRQPKARTTKQKARAQRAQAVVDQGPASRARMAKLGMQGVRSGHTVLDVDGLAVELGGHRLVQGLSLCLGKGERIGIVGPNGCGKTTLLRVLMGDLEPAAGRIQRGRNTQIAYLDQSRSDLHDDETVFDNVADGRSHVRLGDNDVSVHAFLERFLFPPSDQKKLVGSLSGGERARVALARVLRGRTNLVILDEPTNDLDVTTLSALEEALLEFPGTVLVVTHDRWFLDRVATSILAFERDENGAPELVHVHGNYQSYLDYRRARQEVTSTPTPAPAPAPTARDQAGDKAPERRVLTYGERIELEGLPDRIDGAESRVAELEAELGSESFFTRDRTQQAEFLEKLAAARAEAELLVERWAELESRAEGS